SSGALGVMWQPGDTVGVYGAAGTTKNARFGAAISQKARTCKFRGYITSSDNPCYAYYPFDEANASNAVTALKGHLPELQPCTPDGRLVGDYKYGAVISNTDYKFNFRHVFTLLKVSVDATATSSHASLNINDQDIDKLRITVTKSDGTPRIINGDFTFNGTTGAYTYTDNGTNVIEMPWTAHPSLSAVQTGFINLMPEVKSGDKIKVEVFTPAAIHSFETTIKADLVAGSAFNFPIKLSKYWPTYSGSTITSNPYNYQVRTLPQITSFSFEVANNTGKLLDKQLVWDSNLTYTGNSKAGAPKFVTKNSYPVDRKGSEYGLMIPYLYNFRLVPTFTATSGSTVTVNGEVQTSGVSEQDFSHPVTYTVTATDGTTHDYLVTITNTGLPVVVIKQSTSGDFDPEYGNVGWPVNLFVDFYIRQKETDWVSDDEFSVYNPDGTEDVPLTLCGVRQRGNSTQYMPKKALAIKLNSKQGPFGLPSHKRWVLLANWLDHAMIRNAVAFDIAHAQEEAWKNNDAMGTGIPWNVHGEFVELVIDGHHVGNYYLCEQVKIDKKRLNIKKCYQDVYDDMYDALNPEPEPADPEATEGESGSESGSETPTTPVTPAEPVIPTVTMADCGFLLEVDEMYDETYQFTTSKYEIPFMFKDDLPDATIFAAVQAKIQGIEDKIYAGNFAGAYNDLDINSLVDQWLVWELTMNHEFIDPRSTNMFMDGDSKLCAGPVWDFDRATFQNPTTASSMGNSGDRVKPYNKWIVWSAAEDNDCGWYQRLINDPTFQQTVQARWRKMYPYLAGVPSKILEYGNKLQASFEVNNAMWPTTKAAIQAFKWNYTDWSGDELLETYNEVIQNFIQCYNSRLQGMDGLISSGTFSKPTN
ncbi:MAG: CotH kinase family protein, partial [Bacteroidales bacterium]|nr:CotH kinase family protein [Bacteroidales bacterium]